MKPTNLRIAFPLLAALALTGCSSMSHTGRGALLGSGIGAATGAIIGHQTGHREGGAVVGALAGGLLGGLAGQSEDMREERDAALAQAEHANRERQFVERAVTNSDLVEMAQSGISDSVIIGTIRDRGGLFDLSPKGIIALKQQGVSDAVIEFAQKNGHPSETRRVSGQTVAPAPVYYVAPVVPGPVIIDRRPVVVGPRVHIHGRFGPRRRYHRHYHRW